MNVRYLRIGDDHLMSRGRGEREKGRRDGGDTGEIETGKGKEKRSGVLC